MIKKITHIAILFLCILTLMPLVTKVSASASDWGALGSQPGDFYHPMGLDVDVLGNVYVADTQNHRIQIFDANGSLQSTWGTEGIGVGELSSPADLALSVSGNVYVADTGNDRIQVFHADGTFVESLGRNGSGEGEFLHPSSIAVDDSTGKLYVADSGNDRIQIFGAGGFERSWGSRGFGPGELLNPSGIALAPDGTVYVTDTGNHRVQQFTADGIFLRSWGRAGMGTGEFASPAGIAADPYGHVYVADTGNHRVQQFSAQGDFLQSWGGTGADKSFDAPSGVAATSDGLAYVTDTSLQRIQTLRIDYPPEASGVRVSGSPAVGQAVYGEYQFNDQDGDLESRSAYRWYRSTDAAGSGAAAIAGAMGITYILQPEDEGLYIAFEVTPVSDRGAMQGKAARSSFIGPVTQAANQSPIRGYELADQTMMANDPTLSIDVHDWFTDPDSDTLTWSVQVNPPEVADVGLDGTTLSLKPKTGGSAVVTVTVSDGKGGTADDRFIVTVIPAPSINNPPQDLHLSSTPLLEGAGIGTMAGRLLAFDPEGDTLSYLLIAGSGDEDNGTFRIEEGNKLVTAEALTKKSYSIRVGVSDGRASVEQAFTITVTPVDRSAPVIELLGGATVTLQVGETFVDPGVIATDDSDGNLISQVVVGGDPVDTSKAGTYLVTYNVSDTAGNAAREVTRTVIVEAAGTPAGPHNLTAAGGNRQAALNWDTVTGATYYNIYMANTPGPFVQGAVGTATGNTYTVPHLTNGTTYYFVVKAGYPGGLSEASNTVSVTPATVPAAPANVTAVSGDGQAIISFTAPADNGGSAITGYEVTDATGDVAWSGTENPMIIDGLRNGVSYTFTVRAQNRMGSSEPSAFSNTVIPSSQSSGGKITLQSLMLANGTLLPAFQSSITDYKVTVANPVDATTITASVYDPNSKLTINGQAVMSGAGYPINLSVGDNEIVLEVTAPDGVTKGAYKVDVNRLPSANSMLTALNVSEGDLSPSFSRGTLHYAVTVPNGVSRTTVTSLVYDPAATLWLNGIKQESGKASAPIELQAGTNTVTVTVVAQDGVTKTNYTITVTRLAHHPKTGTSAPLPSQTTGETEPGGTAPIQTSSTKTVTFDPSDPGSVMNMKKTLVEAFQAARLRPAAQFNDVANHWANESIKLFAKLGVLNGYSDGSFKPDGLITRGEFSTIIVKIFALNRSTEIPVQFTDMTNHWAKDSIDILASNQLIHGYEDGSFKPDRAMTRAEMVALMTRIIHMNAVRETGSTNFTDITSSWAKEQIQAAARAGIVVGESHQEFAPDRNTTRAEAITVILRSLEMNSEIAALLQSLQ